MTFAPPKSLPEGSWRATVTLASGLTTATATTTIQLSRDRGRAGGLSGVQWIGLSLGSLILVLVIGMGWRYALQNRRRQVPA